MKEKLKELILGVLQWAKDRNLINVESFKGQYNYIHKELTELQDAIALLTKLDSLSVSNHSFEEIIGKKIIKCYNYDNFELIFFDNDGISVSEFRSTEFVRDLIEHEIKDGFGDVMVTLISTFLCKIQHSDYKSVSDADAISTLMGNTILSLWQSPIDYETPIEDNSFLGKDNLLAGLIELRYSLYSGSPFAINFSLICTFAMQAGYDPIECLEQAYKAISNRTGKTINGEFIKDN